MLLVFTGVAICLACYPHLYSLYDIQSRRKHTIERLDWGGGSTAERANRDRLVKSAQTSTLSSLRMPRLVDVRVIRHSNLGYAVVVDWICRAPIANGVQLTFSDGTTTNVRLNDADLEENESNSKSMILFQGVIYRDEFPAPANQTKQTDVVSIALLADNELCSNSFPIESQ